MADEKDTKVETKDGGAKDGADEKDTKVDSKANDEGGELARALDDDGNKDKKGPEKASDKKPTVDLKLSVPDDLKDLVGDAADYVAAAKEAGITQEQLDKLMTVQWDRVKAAAQEADDEAERLSLGWKTDLRADPKLGGANLKQTMQVAERGARAVGGAAFARAVAKHLNGEDPIDGAALVRALYRVGLSMNEDRIGFQGDGAPKKDDDAHLTPQERQFKRMHPNTWARMQDEKNGGRAA